MSEMDDDHESIVSPRVLPSIRHPDLEKASDDLANAKRIQQKNRNESHLTAGCGYNAAKTFLLNAFWTGLWPELLRSGWQKIEGSGENEGSIKFFPPTTDRKNLSVLDKEGRRGKDYYDRIIDVIERVQTRRNTDEKKAADRFTQAQDGQHSKRKLHRGRASNGKKRQRIHMSTPSSTGSVSSEDAPKVTLRRRQPSIVAPTMDLSWKNGGRLYPKQTSQIGDEFQVVDIPAAGTFSEGAHSDLYELIYDPSNNNAAVVNDTISSIVPRNKKEQAFAKLGEMTMQPGYDASSLDVHDVIEQLKASDGSDWTTEEKATFHKEIFRLRKDLTTLSKLMGKDLNTCFTYYLSNFKRSEDYRILKVIRVDERMDDDGPTGSGVDSCAVCGDGGRLIICDGCEGEYHMECLRPRLRTVPEGRWECDECVDKKLLKARDVILSMTKLYAVHQNSDNGETYSYEKPNGGNAGTGDRTFSSGAVSRPTSSVLTAVKAFATGIHALFDVPALPAVCEMDTDTPIKIEDSQPPVEEIS